MGAKHSGPLSSRYTETESGCWIWKGSKDACGYGLIFITNPKKLWRAHRYVWTQLRGDIPNRMLLCHRCDTPACVNPDHLFLGTQADNMRDMAIKGRADRTKKQKGERHSQAKLTEADVLRIRSDKRPRAEVAKEYGVSIAAVSLAARGVTWSHVRG